MHKKSSLKEIYGRLLSGEQIYCFWANDKAMMSFDDIRNDFIIRSGPTQTYLVAQVYEQVSFKPEYIQVCETLLEEGKILTAIDNENRRLRLWFRDGVFYAQTTIGEMIVVSESFYLTLDCIY